MVSNDLSPSAPSPRVGIAALTSPLEVGAGDAPEVLARAEQVLKQAGIPTLSLGILGGDSTDSADATAPGRRAAAEGIAAYILIPVSWFEDYLVVDLLEDWPAPVFLWPRPGMETGALCGTQQLTWFLKRLGHHYGWAFGALESGPCLEKAVTFLRAAGLRHQLRRGRIGLAGHRVNGMTHTAPDEALLKKLIGPRLVHLDLNLMLERADTVSKEDRNSLWADVKERAASVRVDDGPGRAAMGFYMALQESVDAGGLNAVSVGCYPSLMGRPCLAASLLADRGVPMACEGDANGAVAMLILGVLSGEPVHSTDWLDPLDDDTVVFTHCGSGSFSLADDPDSISLDSVRLMGDGVCALFPAKTGPVTLLSLNAVEGGYLVAYLEGEALPAEMVFPGNPVRVRFSLPTADIIDFIFRGGIGHHWAVGYGHHGAVLRAWGDMLPAGAELTTIPG